MVICSPISLSPRGFGPASGPGSSGMSICTKVHNECV